MPDGADPCAGDGADAGFYGGQCEPADGGTGGTYGQGDAGLGSGAGCGAVLAGDPVGAEEEAGYGCFGEDGDLYEWL